jgi:hypothetical protein
LTFLLLLLLLLVHRASSPSPPLAIVIIVVIPAAGRRDVPVAVVVAVAPFFCEPVKSNVAGRCSREVVTFGEDDSAATPPFTVVPLPR